MVLVGGLLAALAAAWEYWPTTSPMEWHTLEEARAIAATQNKPVFVDIYAPWCGPCKAMDKTVFSEDSVQQSLTSRYVLARVNGDDPVSGDTLRKQFGIRAYPTYIILAPTGKERKRHVGFFPASNLIQWLNDSVGVQILRWLEFDKAVDVAGPQRRRVMVLVIPSFEEVEAVDGMFEEPKVGEILGKSFVPTLLVRSNATDTRIIEGIGASPTETLGEVIVLDSDRKEVGRFRLDSQMQFSALALANKLAALAPR